MANERERFFESITIPINANWKENKAEFVNPVQVADMFAEATGIASSLAAQAEELADEIADLETRLDEDELRLARFRRKILADNFAAIKASWGAEIVDAFIFQKAEQQKRLEELRDIEADIDAHKMHLAERLPKFQRIKARLRTLEKNMEWAEQFLNFDKLLQRLNPNGRPR